MKKKLAADLRKQWLERWGLLNNLEDGPWVEGYEYRNKEAPFQRIHFLMDYIQVLEATLREVTDERDEV